MAGEPEPVCRQCGDALHYFGGVLRCGTCGLPADVAVYGGAEPAPLAIPARVPGVADRPVTEAVVTEQTGLAVAVVVGKEPTPEQSAEYERAEAAGEVRPGEYYEIKEKPAAPQPARRKGK